MIARQPILDASLRVMGYELLFRNTSRTMPEGRSATLSVIHNTLFGFNFSKICANKLAFINFTKDVLEEKFYEILPKNQTVIELLEDIELTDAFVEKCREAQKAGYQLALDDVVSADRCVKLKGIVSIVKIDIQQVSVENRQALVKQLLDWGFKVLAEKVETRQEFTELKKMGVTLFQGFFFQRPVIFTCKALPSRIISNYSLFIKSRDFNIEELEQTIKTDPALLIGLLKFTNSVSFDMSEKITKIRHALLLLGQNNFRRWLLGFQTAQANSVSQVVIQNAVVRAHFCEEIALMLKLDESMTENAYLCGLFSLMNVAFETTLQEIVKAIPLDDLVFQTLIKGKGLLGCILQIVISYEFSDVSSVDDLLDKLDLDWDQLTVMYLRAINKSQYTTDV